MLPDILEYFYFRDGRPLVPVDSLDNFYGHKAAISKTAVAAVFGGAQSRHDGPKGSLANDPAYDIYKREIQCTEIMQDKENIPPSIVTQWYIYIARARPFRDTPLGIPLHRQN